MQKIEQGLALQLRKENLDRWIGGLQTVEELRAAALALNQLWTSETAVSRAMATEAAENLGEAWKLSRTRLIEDAQT